jgi:hypothetical protein
MAKECNTPGYTVLPFSVSGSGSAEGVIVHRVLFVSLF